MKYILFFLLSFPLLSHANRELKRLEEIVKINSGSANIKGVTKVLSVAQPWFEELGFKVKYIENSDGMNKSAPLFVAELPGQKKEAITFIMHADTVFEPSSPFQNYTIKGDVINGPGVMDDKGGIVVMARALELLLKDSKTPKYTLRVLISPNEEVGSPGFGKVFKEFSESSWLVLGLEPAHDDGGIVEGRKGNIWYNIEVKGKESHAGRDHKEGINACYILSEKIARLQKLTDYKKNVTVSIGRIEGGQDKYNIVCGWAKAKVDVRVPSLSALNEYKKKIAKIITDKNITFNIEEETAPFSANKASKAMVKNYLSMIKETEGKQTVSYVSGGVGDTNQFSREGIIILDGLGPIGGAAHTEQEFLSISSLESRSVILANFINKI